MLAVLLVIKFLFHSPNFYIDVFDPLVDNMLSVTLLYTMFFLFFIGTTIDLKLVTLSLFRIRVSFNEKSLVFLKVWTDYREPFPSFKFVETFFMIPKIVLSASSSWNVFVFIPLIVRFSPINCLLCKNTSRY